MKEVDKEILRLAGPCIVMNVTVPLLGLVDLAIVGHMGSEAYIGAIAIGTMMFNVMYWLLGFLRMGCSGLTAQSFGRGGQGSTVLSRFLLLSLLTSLAIVCLQWPLRQLFELLFFTTPESEALRLHARTYFNICIWGAPAVLGQYVLTGWFVGMQNTRIPMIVSIAQNIINILFSLLLVYGFGMRLAGVACGTLIAQWTGFFLAALAVPRVANGIRLWKNDLEDKQAPSLRTILQINRDLFLRTVCLVAVNLYFTTVGSWQGPMMLAVNTLLMTLFTLFSYFMDGFAYAGEALCGKYAGAANQEALRTTVTRLLGWGTLTVALFTLVYVLGGKPFLGLLTSEAGVVDAAMAFLPWAWLIPAAGMMAFIYDGVFIGLADGRAMLKATATATLLFFAIQLGLWKWMGNHALWMALIVYLIVRGILLHIIYRKK